MKRKGRRDLMDMEGGERDDGGRVNKVTLGRQSSTGRPHIDESAAVHITFWMILHCVCVCVCVCKREISTISKSIDIQYTCLW